VNNIFSLLDDDDNEADDGFTVVQHAQKTSKPAAKADKTEEQTKSQPARERKPKSERPPRGKGGDKRRNEEGYDGSDKAEKPDTNESRKGGKGRERGERGERGESSKGERRSKGKGSRQREFDRHVSGTGRGKGVAREGHGKYNWGDKTDGAEQPAEGDADAENKPPRRERGPRAQPAEPEQPVEEEEEEESTISFEDYMKAQAEKNHVGPVLEERKVASSEEGFLHTRDHGDGSEDQMYGMAFHEYSGKSKHQEEKEAREGWVNADSVINLKFVDPNSGGKGDRDDRRGKGGKRGGKGRDDARGGRGGNSRAPRAQQGKIELDDTSAFPSLA